MNLRVPGPTPLPREVLEAGSRQMVNHRGPEFAGLQQRIFPRLKAFFQTQGDVLVMTASGTGGLESAVVNTLSPGDRVLAVSIGSFGDRFASIAETYGANVERLEFEWGTPADPDRIAGALRAAPDTKVVLVTHNETSTGVTNPIADIARAIRSVSHDVLIVVDAISSLSSIDIPVDALDLDVVVTGSQKGWMVPPGLAFASVSERGWRAIEAARMPRFYFDYRRYRDSQAKGETPWTPAVSIYFQLDVALEMMEREGLPAILARHQRTADRVRAGVKALGLELFARDERFASNTVTAVRVPDGVEGPAINKTMREQFGVVVAGGQTKLKGKIFRIGHLGWVTDADIDETLAALEKTLAIVKPAGVR